MSKMHSSQIYCTNCGDLVPAEDINIKAMAGTCAGCDHVFSIVPPTSAYASDNFQEDRLPGSVVPSRPKNVTKEAGPSGELYLKRRWFTLKIIFLIVFCIAWDAFLICWYSQAFAQPNAPWIAIIFPIGHLAVGVGLTYYVIAGLLNTTHIFADQHTVIVSHRPIAWLGNKEMNTSDLKRIMVQRGKMHNNHGGGYETFDVMVDVNGEEAKLLGGLEHSEARYISYELSKQLNVGLIGAR